MIFSPQISRRTILRGASLLFASAVPGVQFAFGQETPLGLPNFEVAMKELAEAVILAEDLARKTNGANDAGG